MEKRADPTGMGPPPPLKPMLTKRPVPIGSRLPFFNHALIGVHRWFKCFFAGDAACWCWPFYSSPSIPVHPREEASPTPSTDAVCQADAAWGRSSHAEHKALILLTFIDRAWSRRIFYFQD